jgi:hypothetical protein
VRVTLCTSPDLGGHSRDRVKHGDDASGDCTVYVQQAEIGKLSAGESAREKAESNAKVLNTAAEKAAEALKRRSGRRRTAR